MTVLIKNDMKYIHTYSRAEQNMIFDSAKKAKDNGDNSLVEILKQRTLDAVREAAQIVPEEGYDLPETEYTHLVREFPPSVQEITSLFLNTFMIPKKVVSHVIKTKSTFAMWIKQLEYLKEIGGKYSKQAMPMAYETKKSGALTIGKPAAINQIFQSAISEILDQEKQQKTAKKISDEKKAVKADTPDAERLRDMRNKFKEG